MDINYAKKIVKLLKLLEKKIFEMINFIFWDSVKIKKIDCTNC